LCVIQNKNAELTGAQASSLANVAESGVKSSITDCFDGDGIFRADALNASGTLALQSVVAPS
jgi:hypothetical protein